MVHVVLGDESLRPHICDELSRRYDELISNWGAWRDAQKSDEHKAIVDEVFSKHCALLERTANAFGIEVLPF